MKLSKVSDIFIIKYGNSLSLSDIDIDKDNNEINFISRTEKNNGISAKVRIIDNVKPNPENTISVAVGGSVLSSFLQENPYYTGYHVLTLHPKEKLTTKEMLYYCMCLKANKYKYSYGRQANKTLNDLLVPSIQNIPEWVNKAKIKIPSKESIINNKYNLQTNKWKYFYYGSIFIIERGKSNAQDINKNNFLLIGASQNLNGSNGECTKFNPKYNGNLISVGNGGNTGCGQTFYQPYPFNAKSTVNIISLKNMEMNKYIALFLTTIIKIEKYRFNFGRGWSISRMQEHKIKLPINENNNPDWEFMENYIKSLPYSKSL
jgi:hypothetical protein